MRFAGVGSSQVESRQHPSGPKCRNSGSPAGLSGEAQKLLPRFVRRSRLTWGAMPAWGKMDLWARRNSSFAVCPLPN